MPRFVVRREGGLYAYEKALERAGLTPVAGADEAGRGACAGPLVVAAASVVAKVTRDRIMSGLHEQWPSYDFAGHKGYVTPVHNAALDAAGPCPEHRFSYVNVARRAPGDARIPLRTIVRLEAGATDDEQVDLDGTGELDDAVGIDGAVDEGEGAEVDGVLLEEVAT
jgi:hypothetical protein